MIFLCSKCGFEFEGDEFTDKCLTCGAGKEYFIIQPFGVVDDIRNYPSFDNNEE